MSSSKGYYSLIQYCPDLGRLEAANVGVILFCPGQNYIKARTSRNNRRIIDFFGSAGHDWARINAFRQGLEDRIAIVGPAFHGVEDLERFIAQRANLLQITPPRPMKVENPDRELDELFRDLVGDEPKRPVRSLKKFVGDQVSRAGLDRKVRRDIRVTVPVLDKELEVPFGYKNGRFNLISPVRFEATAPDQAITTACKYAVEGRSLYESPHPELGKLRLNVVGRFRDEDQATPQKVRRILDEYKVKMYEAAEISKLLDEIRSTGTDIGG